MPRAAAIQHAEEATALEAEAAGATPGSSASGLLIEAANQWWLAGEHQKCHTILASVIDLGGETACFARAELLGVLLAEGDRDEAEAELARLAGDPELTEGPCQLVGELLVDHGALTAALEWYDRVLGFWTDERRAAATATDGRRSSDRIFCQQRQRVRKRLGLPAD
ncbi:hypothetical protein GCM10009557_24960 [Virgisporangium ochraceum]|uniref:Tetratricopeptide repeat protein n=1 Tax=Virgisporangium ochraceum TaxID=65505 RepID=A0A8J3ZXL9_9ACTN|nr:hypothetical protein [Virgisporangium ochraceum]GIJ70365.1 hypothetical protein Voc01_052820 [Virgisporangium ochraceum]